MKRMIKSLPVLGLSLALTATGALAQGPGFGWKQGPRGYFSGTDVPREKIEADAKALLGKASTGGEWTSPRGVKHISIVVDKEIVGHLWENVELKTVEIGASWVGRFGKHVQLEKDKKVVGMIWLPN